MLEHVDQNLGPNAIYDVLFPVPNIITTTYNDNEKCTKEWKTM